MDLALREPCHLCPSGWESPRDLFCNEKSVEGGEDSLWFPRRVVRVLRPWPGVVFAVRLLSPPLQKKKKKGQLGLEDPTREQTEREHDRHPPEKVVQQPHWGDSRV